MPPRHAVRFPLAILFAVVLVASAPPSASADGPPQGEVRVVQAWKPLLAEGREAYAAAAHPLLNGYFAWRGAGDATAGASDWSALPAEALEAVRSALADTALQGQLERGAADFVSRLRRVVAPGDTVTLVLLVGGWEETFVHYDVQGQAVVGMQLENFLVPLDSLDAESRDWIASYRIRSTVVPLAVSDIYPWAAYAATGLFAHELRQRRMNDVASLAETVLLHGFGTRFAAALYPESRFAGARPPVSDAALAALEPKWREVGGAWFENGTEPYLAAVYEPAVENAVPEGTTVQEAVEVIGAHLTGEWLQATRVSRTKDEAAEISRLGRLPTLSAWGLLQY